MDVKVVDGLFYTSLVIILLPVVLLLISFNRQPIEYKWLAIILLLSLCCDLTSEILFHLKMNVNLGGILYGILSPFFFSIFFYCTLKWKPLIKPLIIANIMMLTFSLMNMLYIEKTRGSSFSAIPKSLVILALSIAYYYKLLKELPTKKIQDLPLFWVISAFFLTTAGKLVIYAFREYLINIFNDDLIFLWSLHNFLSVLGNLLIGFGVWLQYKHKQIRF